VTHGRFLAGRHAAKCFVRHVVRLVWTTIALVSDEMLLPGELPHADGTLVAEYALVNLDMAPIA